jgi:hypothetical protein
MRIQKNFVLGTLEVVPEEGRLWLKASNCDLRISKLAFKNIEETFSMIDIQGGQAIMVPVSEDSDESMLNFIGDVYSCVQAEIINDSMKDQLKQEFLDHIFKIIQSCVSTYNKGLKDANT